MKRNLLSLLLVATIFGGSVRAQQPPATLPTVTTSGSALVRVVPDLADLCFEVEVRGNDLLAARKQQVERATAVLAALRKAGITEADLQAAPVQITADYTEGRQETATVRFYRVSQSICVTLHDLKKVPDVTADAITAGATGVGGARLRTSQLRKHRDAARAQAIQAAKEKAVALASELGTKVAEPYTITEGASNDWRPSSSNSVNVQASSMDGDGVEDEPASAFAPGTINVNANVTVTFALGGK